MVNFHEIIFSYNFESIRIYLNFFLIYCVPMVIFQIFKKQFLRTIHTLLGSFFPIFTHELCFNVNHCELVSVN